MSADQPPNPYAPPSANVADAPSAEFVLADRGVRLGAHVLDGVIFVAMVYIPIVLGVGVGVGLDSIGSASVGPGILIGVSGLVAWIVLSTMFVVRNGQSIAKKLVGIKTIRSDGSSAGFARIFWLRNVVNGLIGSVPFFGFIYWLTDALFIFGDDSRCLHDKIADTIVVKA
jgi:uncharacterized RDD family membrane protein YckC